MPTIGKWDIFGVNIPDFKISENLGFGGNYGTATSKMRPVDGGGGGSWGPSGTQSTGDYSNYYKPTPTPTNTFTNKDSGGEDPVEKARRLEVERQKKEAEERKRVLKQARSAYNPFFEDLSRQEAEIPTIESDYMNTMNRGYQSQADVVNRGQQAGLEQANQSIGVIKQNQATSLRDLASNLSNAVNAFGQRLGQAGAGDSSAANMANYAYSKLANRNTADVMAQVRGQLAEVETAKQNIVRDAQDKLSALETWKATQGQTIKEYVRSLRDSINSARASGKQSMAESEVSMIREGFSRAMERLQQINDFAVSKAEEVRQNAATSLADAEAFRNNLINAGTINPEAINQAPIDSGTIDNGGGAVLPIPLVTTEEKDKSLADLLYPVGSYNPNLNLTSTGY
jgi:hypothetical protein